jgi:hypothetical protein
LRTRIASFVASVVLAATTLAVSPGTALMATSSFPIPSRNVSAGTTEFNFVDVTSRVAGHTYYSIGIDTSNYSATDTIEVLTHFRIDGTTEIDGCAVISNGGPHLSKDGSSGGLVGCASNLPSFTSKLEATFIVTVPSSGSLSGRVDLI